MTIATSVPNRSGEICFNGMNIALPIWFTFSEPSFLNSLGRICGKDLSFGRRAESDCRFCVADTFGRPCDEELETRLVQRRDES